MRIWLKLRTSHVYVYFLIAKPESNASFTECFELHLHDFRVKALRDFEINAR
jgi:hypothetical protein